jgi:hypothetical protein
MMKVFKMDDCDWVCAKTKEDACEWYINEFGIDRSWFCMSEVIECNIETDTMWYGFSTTGLYDYIHENKDKTLKVKFDECGDDDFVVDLTFKEVIDIEKPTEPYVICSTEY